MNIKKSKKLIRIAIDATKGQEALVHEEFKELQSKLILSGMTISLLYSDPLNYRKLEMFDILIILTPINMKYKSQEIKAILQFADSGAGILILTRAGGDKTLGTNISAILKHFNLKLGEGKVLNLNPNNTDPNSVIGVSTQIIPELFDQDNLIFYNSVAIIADAKQVLFSSTNDNNTNLHSLAAIGDRGPGRLAIFGSPSPFDDSGIGIRYNKNSTLLIKIIKWLSHGWDPYELESNIDSFETFSDIEDAESFENIIKNLVPEISEIVDKDDNIKAYKDMDFDVESTVIGILRSFLANALRDAHTNKELKNIQIEGFDQLIMFLSRISGSLEKITEFLNTNISGKK